MEKLHTAAAVPYVLDNKNEDRVLDLWSRLNQDRVVFVRDPVDDHMASVLVAQLLYLESVDRATPIYLYINTPGGSVSAGMAIYDIMQYIEPEVHTFCMGMAASMGSILLAAGEPGHRYCLPNAEVMIHQPSGGTSGQATDMEIAAAHIKRTKEKLTRLMSEHTGTPFDKCLEDMERDYWMTAEEALKYGIVDKVVNKRDKAPSEK